jgi:hypothetical protein
MAKKVKKMCQNCRQADKGESLYVSSAPMHAACGLSIVNNVILKPQVAFITIFCDFCQLSAK